MSPLPKGNFFLLHSDNLDLDCQSKFRLVGKLLYEKKFNFKALRSVFLSTWKYEKRFKYKICIMDFLFVIFLLCELKKVLLLGLWNFRGSLIILRCWMRDCVFNDLSFDYFDFGVQTFNISSCKLNRSNVECIENFIGSFLESELVSYS